MQELNSNQLSAEVNKALEMVSRYQITHDPSGEELIKLVKTNPTGNPVALVAQLALHDCGIIGVDVIKGNPEKLFEVIDINSAEYSLSNLRDAIAAAKLTDDHTSIANGMSAIFTDVMDVIGHEINLPAKRALRRGMS